MSYRLAGSLDGAVKKARKRLSKRFAICRGCELVFIDDMMPVSQMLCPVCMGWTLVRYDGLFNPEEKVRKLLLDEETEK